MSSISKVSRLSFYSSFPILKKSQWAKVAAVALGCFSLLALQMRCSLPFSLGAALLCSSITLVSEYFRGEQENWFAIKKIDAKQLLIELAIYLIAFPIIMHIGCVYLGLPLQFVACTLMEYDLRSLVLAVISAPIVEEIIFRGFVQERIKDLLCLVNNYVYPISKKQQRIFVYLGQSSAFALAHFQVGRMIRGTILKVLFFGRLILNGIYFQWKKNTSRSLFSPTIVHGAQNMGAIILGRLLAIS